MFTTRYALHHSSWKALLQQVPLSFITLFFFSIGAVLMVNRPTLSQESTMRTMDIRAKNNHPLAIKEIRNLQSADLLKDLEIEIKNISDKPIYYACIHLRFPDIELAPGRNYGFSLHYGDNRLAQLEERAGPQDSPINPGETYVFKVHEKIWKGFEAFKSRNRLPPSATSKIELVLLEVSFGNGTGL